MNHVMKMAAAATAGTVACLASWMGIHKAQSTSFGFISPDGQIYETAFVLHRLVAQTICDSIGIKPGSGYFDAYLALERLGWVKFVGNGFFWDRHPTGEQMTAIVDYCIRHGNAEIYVNSWQRRKFLCDAQIDGTFMQSGSL